MPRKFTNDVEEGDQVLTVIIKKNGLVVIEFEGDNSDLATMPCLMQHWFSTVYSNHRFDLNLTTTFIKRQFTYWLADFIRENKNNV